MATAISSAVSSASTVAQGSLSKGTLAQNFETFLGLLTTQLKNQSPLDPLNTNEFTQQLVQFASVEQQMKSNDSLNSLLAATRSSNVTNALGFVGAKVTADGSTARLRNGSAEWRLDVARSAPGATVTITDKTGATVFSETKNLSAGTQAYIWRGSTSNGGIAPDGEYTVNIVANDATGKTVDIRSEVSGTVDSVDVSGSETVLTIGTLTIPVSKVKIIQR